MKISPTTWGFIGLALTALILLGLGAAAYLFNDEHTLFACVVILLDAGCAPYMVYAWKQTPVFKGKDDPED